MSSFCEMAVLDDVLVYTANNDIYDFTQIENKEEKKPAMQSKFMMQGQGVLKVLIPGITHSGINVDPKKQLPKGRLVVCQKGTSTILLNSPLWISTKFETMPQIASGCGVRFVAVDQTEGKRSFNYCFCITIFVTLTILHKMFTSNARCLSNAFFLVYCVSVGDKHQRLSVYCLKFESEKKKNEFLSAMSRP